MRVPAGSSNQLLVVGLETDSQGSVECIKPGSERVMMSFVFSTTTVEYQSYALDVESCTNATQKTAAVAQRSLEPGILRARPCPHSPPRWLTCRGTVPSSYETDQLAAFVPRREHALKCLLQDLRADARGARRSLLLAVLAAKIEG